MEMVKHAFVRVENQKFVKADLSLDNQYFSDCEFEDCNFLYSGGPLVMNGCRLRNCAWQLQGSAAPAIESLTTCGWHIVPHDHAASVKTVC
jgi:hypothetical protein